MITEPTSRKDSNLDDRFREAMLALVDLKPGDGLVAAFSGGADSTALVYLLAGFSEEFDIKPFAAHLDHGIRGSAAERDRDAAATVAEKLGWPFFWERTDCPSLAREKAMSLEEAAREARYDFLERIRNRTGARYAATGHTADDNAEAVLLNLFRGTGLTGLAGIPPLRGPFLRPLLTFRHEELVRYLTARGIPWVEDASNRDFGFTRNRVRHDLLPRLAGDYNPEVKQALNRTAGLIRDEEQVWEQWLAPLRDRILNEAGPALVYMDRAALLESHRAVTRRLIRSAVARINGSTRKLNLEHVEAVRSLIQSGRGALDLPGDCRAWIEEARLYLGRRTKEPVGPFDYPLPTRGQVELVELSLVITMEVKYYSDKIDPKALPPRQVVLDLERLNPPLRVRNFRPGDRFQPLGMRGHKKLSDFFIDLKVPAAQRGRIPLVEDAGGIVWVGGYRPAQRVRIGPWTRKVLLICLNPRPNGLGP